MKVDATLQAVGRQCGIDVNAIISKYKNDVEQHSSKPEEVQSFTNKFDGDSSRNLDQLQICEVIFKYNNTKVLMLHYTSRCELVLT
jgi:hypothetical protein